MKVSRRAFLASQTLAVGYFALSNRQVTRKAYASGLTIGGVTDNRANYPGSTIPKRELLEITFQLNGTVATNLQMPYDPSPPPGISPSIGITANAQFSSDNFKTTYTQPAFYYQDFQYQQIFGSDWLYPTSNYSWKVRWAPPLEGTWQYRLTAQDASGSATSAPVSFTVTSSSNHGFVRVSSADSRYFQFEDGTYFPGLGYNMNYNNISWDNPISQNQYNFGVMGANGIQLVRHWLSHWTIFGCYQNSWRSLVRGSNYDSQTTAFSPMAPGSDSAMYVIWSANTAVWQGSPGMMLGWLKETPACKPNTSYHVTISYNIPITLKGPAIAGYPYGLVAKFGGWLQTPGLQPRLQDNWRSGQEVSYPAALANQVSPGMNQVVVTPYANQATNGWATLEGDITTNSSIAQNGNNWLRFFYLAVENCVSDLNGGDASTFIDNVTIRENLGGGQYGPNIVSRPWMSHLHYFDQKLSYAFDQALGLAKQNGIYFKLVCLEKNDLLENSFDFNGNPQAWNGANNANFYGNYATITKVRWLQQAYWRYLQARWGYSANIHSWELLNEGDPWNSAHYTLANVFGQYMHQFAPNDHLVTTSTWNSFPRQQLWANPAYPFIDYADLHQYTLSGSDPVDFDDTAAATISVSTQYGARTPGGAGKPIIRGETGFVDSNTNTSTTQFVKDTQGVWLHKFLWGQLNSGGMLECYWYDLPHLHDRPYGGNTYDHRPLYKPFYNFVSGLPLNNGAYQDLGALVTNSLLRVLGQRDLASGRAHLWIDNSTDTWNNVVNNPTAIVPQSGTATFQMLPNTAYTLQQFDTYLGSATPVGSVTSDPSGTIAISIINLSTDLAYLLTSTLESVTLPIQK